MTICDLCGESIDEGEALSRDGEEMLCPKCYDAAYPEDDDLDEGPVLPGSAADVFPWYDPEAQL